MTRWPVAVLAAVLALSGCTGGDRVTLTVAPAALADEPVTVRVDGLSPGTRATLTAAATDAAGVRWRSSVESTDGTADPAALLGGMVPDRPVAYFDPPAGGWDVALAATVDGREVATGTTRRRSAAEAGVTSVQLRPSTDGVYGVAYRPADTGTPRPAVLLFGGSEGGLGAPALLEAAQLAAHGHPTLAIAYFAVPGLPPTLSRIPLEYFARALAVLRAQPGVDPDRVWVRGASRGGEVALLLGATYPRLVHGVIALVPSSYVNASTADPAVAGWTLGGRDVPWGRPFNVPAADVDPRALIPVERIAGPVLLACGDLDLVWRSCGFVAEVRARLVAAGRPVTALTYPGGGHYVGTLQPYLPFTDAGLRQAGGEVPATQVADAEIRASVLRLLGS